MPADISRAKELYFNYGGSTFHMYREGDSKEYDSFNITKEQEREWLNELFEERLNKVNFNDSHTFPPLTYVIQNHLNAAHLEKLLNLIDKKFDTINNQYIAFWFGREIFNLLYDFSRNEKNISRELKLKCIYASENLAALAKDLSIPEGFKIPYFSDFSDGQTQEVYILRQLTTLEVNLDIAKILQ